MTTIAFIGAGNIAKALIGGYIAAGSTGKIWASDPFEAQLELLPDQVHKTTDNIKAVTDADLIVLCVKPNMMADICKPLRSLAKGKLFVSVAAGVTSSNLASWLGSDTAIIRCMPNTPALIGEGMTGLFSSKSVNEAQKGLASSLLATVGEITWFVEESALDAVTAVSGSGPAYFFLMLEAMQSAAVELGLSSEVARTLVEQTALGAVKMALQSDSSAAELRHNVTSPGGTTAAAIAVLQNSGFETIMLQALKAAAERSKALSSD